MHHHPHGTAADPVRQLGHGYRAARAVAVAALPIALGAAVGCVGAAPAMADAPSEIACGTVLTTSVVLHGDLTCSGDGLIIGADGITVNLAGHSITGAGTGSGVLAEGRSGLTVHSGTIAGFATDVDLSQVQNATFTALTIQGGEGVHLLACQDVQFGSTNLTDSSAFVQASQRTTFDGLVARQSRLTLFEANFVTVAHSDLVDTPMSGIESDRASVVDSRFDNSPISYQVTSRNWLIQNNTIRRADVGVRVLVASPGGRIIGNTFIGNGVGVSVDVNVLDEAEGTVISDNTFLDNGAAGVLVDAADLLDAPTVTISRNRFIHNGFNPEERTDHLGRPVADGAHIAAPVGATITVADNLANHNAAYGIFADPGSVIDGGGNKSIGDQLGCLGVVCHPEV